MWTDTHCHLDGEEFDADRLEVMQRAQEAGVQRIFLPAIDLTTSKRILAKKSGKPWLLYSFPIRYPILITIQLLNLSYTIISQFRNLPPSHDRPAPRGGACRLARAAC